MNALRAYEQTSSVQEKAASECIHLEKQYEEAHDSIKEEKPFVLEYLKDFTVQQFSEPQNCTFNLTAFARIWNGTVK